MSSNAEAAKPEQNQAKRGRKLSPRIITAVVGSLLLALLAGGYLYLDSKYSRANDLLNKKQYNQALAMLAEIPTFFMDVIDLKTYTEGCAALDRGDFQNARSIFDGLNGFRNSSEMMLETGYQEAVSFLEAKECKKAVRAFASLGKYKDAETMVLEAEYQAAAILFQSKEYEKAAAAFIALGEYHDAKTQAAESYYQLGSDLLNRKEYIQANVFLEKLTELEYKDASQLLKEANYQIAVDYYHRKEYKLAYDFFFRAYGYKDCSKYLDIIYAHKVTFYSDGDLGLLDSYKNLVELGDFEDAKSLKSDKKFDLVRFNGRWETAKGADYVEIDINGFQTWIDSSLPIPIRHYGPGYTKYRFRVPNRDGKIFVETDRKLVVAYELTMISDNEIRVYCCDNKKTYTMTKK